VAAGAGRVIAVVVFLTALAVVLGAFAYIAAKHR
jgi:hypothetical protein